MNGVMYSFNTMFCKVPLTFLSKSSDDVVGPELKKSDLWEDRKCVFKSTYI